MSKIKAYATTAQILDFCAHHDISAVAESFPMSKVNNAVARVESGKARYRLVLKNDF